MARRNKPKKKPRARGGIPDVPKAPREEPAADPEYLQPSWRLARMDMSGPFGWQELSKPKLLEIRGKLARFEASTWHEILVTDNHRNHTVPVNRLSPEALKRLKEIKQDDLDELTSLRLSGRERVWGIRENGVFYLLWWDPEHQVYQTTPRHT